MASEPQPLLQTSPTHPLAFNLALDRPDFLTCAPPTPSTFPPHTHLAIRPTLSKGLGVFALRDIPAGSVILYERPLLMLPKAQTPFDLGELPVLDPLDAIVGELGREEREVFLGMGGYSCRRKRGSGSGGGGEEEREIESVNRAVLGSYGFSIKKGAATGVFGIAGRINHCCAPNCWWEWRELELERGDVDGGERGERDGGLLVWNSWKLMEGEELTIDYGHKSGVNGALRNWYGFVCECGACTDGESEVSEDGMDGDEGDGVVEAMKAKDEKIDMDKDLI